MATVLYINPDPINGPPRATILGCGWMPAVPTQYAALVTSLPAVVLSGGGTTVVISDSPPTHQCGRRVRAGADPRHRTGSSNDAGNHRGKRDHDFSECPSPYGDDRGVPRCQPKRRDPHGAPSCCARSAPRRDLPSAT